MSETGGQYASQRSTKHAARVDDELAQETEAMMRAERATREGEWRQTEPQADGDPDIDRDPAGTMTGGTPAGLDADTVAVRAELGRWLTRAPFPGKREDLVAAVRDQNAPDAVVAELERLPQAETFARVGEVVRALGYPTES